MVIECLGMTVEVGESLLYTGKITHALYYNYNECFVPFNERQMNISYITLMIVVLNYYAAYSADNSHGNNDYLIVIMEFNKMIFDFKM